MLHQAMNSIARERAGFLRDVEYIRENVEDSAIQDYIDACYEKASGRINIGKDVLDRDVFEAEEIEDAIKQIPTDDLDSEQEIDRIMHADKNIDIDTILGLADDINHIDESEEE